MVAECNAQGQHADTATKRTDFLEKILMSNDLRVLAYMQDGSTYLHTVHSAEKYVGDFLDPDENSGNIIAFVGDKTTTMTPLGCKVPESNIKLWLKVRIPDDDDDMQQHYGSTSGKLFNSTSVISSETQVPRVILVPTTLVLWMTTKRHTPWEFYKHLKEIQTKLNTTDTGCMKCMLEYTKATACSKARCANGKNSLVTASITGIMSQNEVIQTWSKQRLNGTLGIDTPAQQQPVLQIGHATNTQ